MKALKIITTLFLLSVLSTSCDKLLSEEPATKTSMEGVWEAARVTTSDGIDITNQLKFPILAFHLSSDRTIISTAGPLIMFIVYGNNKYTEIASKVDQVFNYATLSFNGGEFFIEGGQQSRFTLEMKLEGLPGQKALTTLLEMIGIGNAYLDAIVYHKFINVGVQFEDDYNTMIWDFDENTSAVYNTKDSQGNYLLWNGWPTNSFQKCQIVFAKRAKDIKDLVRENS